MPKSQPDSPRPATGSKSGSRTPKPVSSSQNDPKTSLIPTPNKRRAQTVEPRATATTPPTMPTKLQELGQELQNCKWEELQDRFADAMHERAEFESTLQKETAELLEVGS